MNDIKIEWAIGHGGRGNQAEQDFVVAACQEAGQSLGAAEIKILKGPHASTVVGDGLHIKDDMHITASMVLKDGPRMVVHIYTTSGEPWAIQKNGDGNNRITTPEQENDELVQRVNQIRAEGNWRQFSHAVIDDGSPPPNHYSMVSRARWPGDKCDAPELRARSRYRPTQHDKGRNDQIIQAKARQALVATPAAATTSTTLRPASSQPWRGNSPPGKGFTGGAFASFASSLPAGATREPEGCRRSTYPPSKKEERVATAAATDKPAGAYVPPHKRMSMRV